MATTATRQDRSALRWDWLTPERARAYAVIVLANTILIALLRVASSFTGAGLLGFPIRSDFVSFWAASRLALAGHAADVYVVAAHWAAEQAALPGTGYSAFLYPPVWLLLCLPLSLLPFWWSLAAFLAASGAGYFWVVRRILPGAGVACLAFPAVAMNAVYGQNGLLTAALTGGGMLALARRPWLAGALLGCLAYKPHMAAMVPVALVAGRHWRALAAMAATSLLLAAASLALFGAALWRDWLAEAPFARSVLEQGLATNIGWVSWFRAIVQMGAGIGVAYSVQAIVAGGAVAAMIVAIRRRPDAILAVLPLATVLATPFLLAYDLALLALPMAWLVREGTRRGFLAWEKPLLCLGFLAPALAIMLSAGGLPLLGPLVMLGLMLLAVRAAQS
jgi:hypothetical protein